MNQLEARVGAGNDYVVVVSGWDCQNGKPLTGASTNCGSRTKRDDIRGYSLSQGLEPSSCPPLAPF
jgi:hypothetical protein